jgi:hypothetical protein
LDGGLPVEVAMDQNQKDSNCRGFFLRKSASAVTDK